MPDGVRARGAEVVRERRRPVDGEHVAGAGDVGANVGGRVADDRRLIVIRAGWERSRVTARVVTPRPTVDERWALGSATAPTAGLLPGASGTARRLGGDRRRSLDGRLRVADRDLRPRRKPHVTLRHVDVDAGHETAEPGPGAVLPLHGLLEHHGIAPVAELDSLVRADGQAVPADREARDGRGGDVARGAGAPGVALGRHGDAPDVHLAAEEGNALELGGRARMRRSARPGTGVRRGDTDRHDAPVSGVREPGGRSRGRRRSRRVASRDSVLARNLDEHRERRGRRLRTAGRGRDTCREPERGGRKRGDCEADRHHRRVAGRPPVSQADRTRLPSIATANRERTTLHA